MEHLDSDLLRTFIAVAQAGSVTDGAALIHRSQSATSLQIKRLEDVIGQPVFERHGRGITLSDAGRQLLPVAHDVTARLDATLRDISEDAVKGKLRFGIPDDHGKSKLSQIIAAFSRQYPQVELDVTCAISSGFPDALDKGKLDLAIYEVETPTPREELLFEDPTCWVSSAHRQFAANDPLPVALFDHACWWRDAAIRSLEARNKPYRVIYSSQSVSGIMAAVDAGIGVGLLGRSTLKSGLTVLPADFGLGPTPTSKLVLAENNSQTNAPLDAMKTAIRSAFLTTGGKGDAGQDVGS